MISLIAYIFWSVIFLGGVYLLISNLFNLDRDRGLGEIYPKIKNVILNGANHLEHLNSWQTTILILLGLLFSFLGARGIGILPLFWLLLIIINIVVIAAISLAVDLKKSNFIGSLNEILKKLNIENISKNLPFFSILTSFPLVILIGLFTTSSLEGEGELYEVKCNATPNTKTKTENLDRYELGNSNLPLKNGKAYVTNSPRIADEIFNIVIAQGRSLARANGYCVSAMVQRSVKSGRDDSHYCETIFQNIYDNPGYLDVLKNDKKYKLRSSVKQDGYYEKCAQNGYLREKFTLKNGVHNGVHELYEPSDGIIFKNSWKEGRLERNVLPLGMDSGRNDNE